MTELEVMKICCAAIGDNKCRTGSLVPHTDVLTAELPVLDPVMMVVMSGEVVEGGVASPPGLDTSVVPGIEKLEFVSITESVRVNDFTAFSPAIFLLRHLDLRPGSPGHLSWDIIFALCI